MPRGRPPIPRTKEEALIARREQVRKNVQAFRKRKQSQNSSNAVRTRTKDDAYTFVLEDLGQLESGDHGHRVSSENATVDSNIPQINKDRARAISSQETFREPSVLALRHGTTSGLSFVASVPASVDGGPASLQQYSSNFTHAFFSSRATTGTHWSQMLPALVNRNHTLDTSIQALCLLQVGHNRGNHIFPQSLLLYNRALKGLQSSLVQHGHGFKVEIFAAMMILGVYELLQGTSVEGKSWMAHFEGGATYINLFSYSDVIKTSPQMAFHFLEAICIFDALATRKQTWCSTSKWWRDTVDQFGGEAYGSLLRMLTSLPGVLEQCDRAMSLEISSEAVDEWIRLLRLCLRLEDAFLGWLKRTTASEKPDFQPLIKIIAEPIPLGETDLPLVTTFPDLFTARLYLLYWSSIILLYDTIIAILRKFHPYSSGAYPYQLLCADIIDSRSTTQAYVTTSHLFSTIILRSVPYCLEQKHIVLGKSILLLPLITARDHFRKCEENGLSERCDQWLERLGWEKLKFGLRV